MPLIAKRKVGTTWRQAVEARAAGDAASCLADFDARIAAGAGETEAAYRVLQARGLLWHIDLPGDPAARPPATAEDVPPVEAEELPVA